MSRPQNAKVPFTDLIDHIHDNRVNPKTREIFLFPDEWVAETQEEEPGVNYALANKFIINMSLLESVSHEPITIQMKTCGGDWTEGMAIYDAIKKSPCHVTIVNHTHARSMSSIILQAADWRIMRPSSYFMFHEGCYGDDGELKGVRSTFEFHEKHGELMYEIYMREMAATKKFKGKRKKQLRKILQDTIDIKTHVYLMPEEAIEWGFADVIDH